MVQLAVRLPVSGLLVRYTAKDGSNSWEGKHSSQSLSSVKDIKPWASCAKICRRTLKNLRWPKLSAVLLCGILHSRNCFVTLTPIEPTRNSTLCSFFLPSPNNKTNIELSGWDCFCLWLLLSAQHLLSAGHLSCAVLTSLSKSWDVFSRLTEACSR